MRGVLCLPHSVQRPACFSLVTDPPLPLFPLILFPAVKWEHFVKPGARQVALGALKLLGAGLGLTARTIQGPLQPIRGSWLSGQDKVSQWFSGALINRQAG